MYFRPLFNEIVYKKVIWEFFFYQKVLVHNIISLIPKVHIRVSFTSLSQGCIHDPQIMQVLDHVEKSDINVYCIAFDTVQNSFVGYPFIPIHRF